MFDPRHICITSNTIKRKKQNDGWNLKQLPNIQSSVFCYQTAFCLCTLTTAAHSTRSCSFQESDTILPLCKTDLRFWFNQSFAVFVPRPKSNLDDYSKLLTGHNRPYTSAGHKTVKTALFTSKQNPPATWHHQTSVLGWVQNLVTISFFKWLSWEMNLSSWYQLWHEVRTWTINLAYLLTWTHHLSLLPSILGRELGQLHALCCSHTTLSVSLWNLKTVWNFYLSKASPTKIPNMFRKNNYDLVMPFVLRYVGYISLQIFCKY